eukprot:jgi/Tetstr1/448188/TSEL_035479.t1
MLSIDLQDSTYAVGIAAQDRDYFTIEYRGMLYRLPGLPMGWSLSPYYFCSLIAAFNRYLRRPDFAITSQGERHVNLRIWGDVRRYATTSVAARCRAQFMFLAIKPARLYLREPHDALRTQDSWSGRVKITHQFRRQRPQMVGGGPQPQQRRLHVQARGEPMPYMHVDRSGYGWGAVLNETTEARGFRYNCDREMHITYKELKAFRYAVLTFLSELRGRQARLHKDMGVVHILADLTSRSLLLRIELGILWFILASNDISIRARYIKTTANIRPDRNWHMRLSEIASDMVVFPPSPDLFEPGRLGVRAGVGPPKWPVIAFRLPLRAWGPVPGPGF